jgi:hypothetical protein
VRDYVKFWFAAESPPDAISDFPQWFLTATLDSANATAQGMTPVFGGQIVVGQVAVRLHKKLDVFSLIQVGTQIAWKDGGRGGAAQFDFAFDGPKGGSVYRAEGINSKTEKKAQEADFSGAPGLLEALQGFVTLAADLTRMGEIRKAEIVLYAYRQVIHQTWTITQAIQYLIDNRITATVGG